MVCSDDLKTIFNKGKKIATASLWDVEKKD